MDNQEVIKTLRELRRETNDSWYEEVYSMAISALEKQIPKKAVRDERPRYGMGYEYYDWACPTCGRLLAFECDRNRSNIHHCRCGQAIDWGDE